MADEALSTLARARLAAQSALGKRADALVVLDVQGLSTIADYFIICTGQSTTQLRTIAEAVETALRAQGCRLLHREGVPESGWLLLDYGDVILHAFLPETRAFYGLERLWGDAPALSVGE